MKHSAGIIPFKIVQGNILFFLGHPGGRYPNKWSLLKGNIEEGETAMATALREFHEESGISLDMCQGDMFYLATVQHNHEKQVTAFAIDMTKWFDIDPSKCSSNLCEYGWPEIDKYAWFTLQQVKCLTIAAHMPFYDTIVKHINANNANSI